MHVATCKLDKRPDEMLEIIDIRDFKLCGGELLIYNPAILSQQIIVDYRDNKFRQIILTLYTNGVYVYVIKYLSLSLSFTSSLL